MGDERGAAGAWTSTIDAPDSVPDDEQSPPAQTPPPTSHPWAWNPPGNRAEEAVPAAPVAVEQPVSPSAPVQLAPPEPPPVPEWTAPTAVARPLPRFMAVANQKGGVV